MKELRTVERGEIYFANIPKLQKERTCIQQGKRPVVIISNEKANRFSPVVTVVVLTSRMTKHQIPTQVYLGEDCGLKTPSIALCEMILTLDKEDLLFRVGKVTENKMREIDRANFIQTQPKFDEAYIEQLLFKIKKTKEMFFEYKDEFLKELFNNTVEELKIYCKNYGKDYSRYLSMDMNLESNNIKKKSKPNIILNIAMANQVAYSI